MSTGFPRPAKAGSSAAGGPAVDRSPGPGAASAPGRPPARLYHATSPPASQEARRVGLTKGGWHHVRLDSDPHRAARRGSGSPAATRNGAVILVVDAEAMSRDGYRFYRGTAGAWLADRVPARYIVGTT